MDRKKIIKRILFPPIWLILILTVICTVALVLVFVRDLEEHPVSYAVYVLSAYTVTVLCIFFIKVLPKQFNAIKQKVYDHPIGNRYMTDAAFRTHISLYLSLLVNILYVGVNIISFVLYRSAWFTVLAVYYTILALMRFLLARYASREGIGKNRMGELKSTGVCSWILLTLNFVLTGAVMMILYQNKGFNYNGMLIYVMAAYTFYITTHAIIDMIKYRKYDSPVMMMTKIIAFSAALVSMLSLETAMFSQFGQDMSDENKWLMIALTGAGVSIAVVTMAIYMIVRSACDIKKLRNKNGK